MGNSVVQEECASLIPEKQMIYDLLNQEKGVFLILVDAILLKKHPT